MQQKLLYFLSCIVRHSEEQKRHIFCVLLLLLECFWYLFLQSFVIVLSVTDFPMWHKTQNKTIKIPCVHPVSIFTSGAGCDINLSVCARLFPVLERLDIPAYFKRHLLRPKFLLVRVRLHLLLSVVIRLSYNTTLAQKVFPKHIQWVSTRTVWINAYSVCINAHSLYQGFGQA